jgi:hypothetical protein
VLWRQDERRPLVSTLPNRSLAYLTLCWGTWLAWGGVIAQQPTFRTGTELVLIDLTVVDWAGQPVGDLKPEDFTVTVDRKPRTVVSAQFIQ